MPRFSETVIDHARSPNNRMTLPEADTVGVAGQPGRGQYLVVQLVIADGCIKDSAFQCHNCGATVAAGSVLMELIDNQTVESCLALTTEDVIQALDGLPPDKTHCAHMAVIALRDALADNGQPADGDVSC